LYFRHRHPTYQIFHDAASAQPGKTPDEAVLLRLSHVPRFASYPVLVTLPLLRYRPASRMQKLPFARPWPRFFSGHLFLREKARPAL
jgi:hypothetical protein